MFTFTQINAQVWTTNSCTSLGSSVYGPMFSTTTSNSTNRIAVIYPASKLTAISGKLLTSIYFNRSSITSSLTGSPNFKIYIKEVSNVDWDTLAIDWATQTTGAIVDATAQTSEPVPSCFNSGINGSVWFSFIAATSGSVEISTDFSGGTLQNRDTELSVYAASGVNGSKLSTLSSSLGCDQDGGLLVNNSSFLSLSGLIAGATYYIQVDRKDTTTAGIFGI